VFAALDADPPGTLEAVHDVANMPDHQERQRVRDDLDAMRDNRGTPARAHDRANKSLAMTPTEELLKLPFLELDQVKDSLHAYQLSKRGNE
jgi:hypothetical protein